MKNAKLGMVAVTFSARELELIDRMVLDLRDSMGRVVSRSAILRALVRYAANQGVEWVQSALDREVGEDLQRHWWGRPRRS